MKLSETMKLYPTAFQLELFRLPWQSIRSALGGVMAYPYLALRPDRNGPASRASAAGSKNPPALAVGSVNNNEID